MIENNLLPEGCVLTRSWLMKHGFGVHAVDNLVKRNPGVIAADVADYAAREAELFKEPNF